MSHIVKVLHTAKTETTGDRDNGTSRSSDGLLGIKLSTPGSARIGANPEQLFAAGWLACFEGALGIAARKMKIASRLTWPSTPKWTYAEPFAHPQWNTRH